ncbi:MAG: DedA family protein [Propionibacteriaceae bacterium]
MSQLVALLLALPPAAVLAAALVLPAVESSALVGLVVPGETAVFVAGMTSHAGHLPLWTVMTAAATGAVAGDQIGFLLGRRWGPSMLDRLPRRLRSSGRVDMVTELIRRRGGWAVLLGRWTALLRALVPGLAGASGIRRRTFTVANLIGGVTWAIVVAVLGYEAGAAYQQVIATMGRAGEIGLGVLIVVLVGTAFGRRIAQRHRDKIGRHAAPAPRS